VVPLAAPGFLAELRGSRGEDPDKNPTVLVVVHCKVRISGYQGSSCHWTLDLSLQHKALYVCCCATIKHFTHKASLNINIYLHPYKVRKQRKNANSVKNVMLPLPCSSKPITYATPVAKCHSRIGLFSPQWVHLD